MTTGKYLLDLGFKLGKWFKETPEYLNAHALTGDAMLTYLREKGLPPTPFFKNIRADTAVA